jgi:hypothetical protein
MVVAMDIKVHVVMATANSCTSEHLVIINSLESDGALFAGNASL